MNPTMMKGDIVVSPPAGKFVVGLRIALLLGTVFCELLMVLLVYPLYHQLVPLRLYFGIGMGAVILLFFHMVLDRKL